MSSFLNLKRNSSNNYDNLTKAVESMNSSTTYGSEDKDKNYWKCEVDKAGNGYAIIRFLPISPQDSDENGNSKTPGGAPFVKYYDHGFQGPGGWYIENSLTSIGQADPLSEYNSHLWRTGLESDKEQARKQKRRLHFVANVYIIKDSKNPENEGKVKLFKFGKKIFDKIIGSMQPQFEDETKIDPFNLWEEGANFKLKIRKIDNYQNYDLSEFESPSPLFEDDSKLEAIWKSQHSLLEVIDPKNFKSYDELKKRLDRVLRNSSVGYKPTTVEQLRSESKPVKPTLSEVESSFVDEEDDDLNYFRNLIEED
jgi:hypothetical protein